MDKNIRLVILGMTIVLLFFVTKSCYEKEIEKLKAENKKTLLRNDKLVKLNETTYTKYVADSLTKKELQKEVDKLKLKIKNPKILTRIVYVNKDIEKEIDGIVVNDSIIKILDHYPNKENATITYDASLNVITQKGNSKFSFKEQQLNLVVSQDKNGMWRATLKTPNEYVNINSLDVLTLPSVTEETKLKNFGWLLGGKYNTTLDNDRNNVELLGGFRYKRINVIGSFNTDRQIGAGALFEF
jgi:hypothetical protein